MTYIIDAHEDIAYNGLTFGRDYRRSAEETRRLEIDTPIPGQAGQTVLGWPDYQRGQVALIFGTLFASPRMYAGGAWESQTYADAGQAARLYHAQIDFYHRLGDESPDQFTLVKTRRDLAGVLKPWVQFPADPQPGPRPVGLVLSLEGGEGLGRPEELEEYWQMGLRAVGPVWAGTRFCGATLQPGGFTREGYHLLEVMGDLGYILDLAHMTEQSALQALDRYEGTVIASHVNAQALLNGGSGEIGRAHV